MARPSSLISYYALSKLFKDNLKLIERGEIAYKSGHLESCTFDGTLGIIRATLQASMKHKTYKVQVILY